MTTIFHDKIHGAYGRLDGGRVLEINFEETILGNIYRAKLVNKLAYNRGYFLEYEEGKEGFLKSKVPLNLGDSLVVQVVREGANGKLPLLSRNFFLENKNYSLTRYPSSKKPIQKPGGDFSKKDYNDLLQKRRNLEAEENFLPSPKLLLKKDLFKDYLEAHQGLNVEEVDIFERREIRDSLATVFDRTLYYKDYSVIIDELETLTVIDINTHKLKSGSDQDYIFSKVNDDLTDFLAYQLKLRNIGGMVVVDFLRSSENDDLEKSFKESLDAYSLDYEIFGLSPMGLFELSIKRRGPLLRERLMELNES